MSLKATIAKDGTVKEISIVSGNPIFADAALEAVRQWRYEPFLVDGAAVEIPTVITVTFSLEKGGYDVGSQGEPENMVPPAAPVQASSEPPPTYAVGGDVKAPKPIYMPDPDYSKSARKAKVQGSVALGIIVTPQGNVSDVQICKGLEASLDQNAIETVRRWKFEPATKDGQPVAVHVNVDVTFRVY